jgi:cell division protein FtsB
MDQKINKPETQGEASAAKVARLEQRPWTERMWRPTGTVVAVGLAMLLTWHVINGQHGLSVWHQKRMEDRELQKEIQSLEQENDQLRRQIGRLQSDPDAIERVAREKLHYARPNEVIYKIATPAQGAPAK